MKTQISTEIRILHKLIRTLNKIISKSVMSILIGCLAINMAHAQTQSSYPAKTVRLVVGFPAGGPVDTLARAIAEKLSKSMGGQFVVENIAGATGIIGNDRVAKSAPDGYTLLMGASTIPIQASLNKNLPYDTIRDFTPIAYIGDSPLLVVVPPSLPVNNLRDLISYLKTNNGKLSYASPGTGSANHLAGELMKTMTGLSVTHIPYKGGAPAEIDVMGGHVTYLFGSFTTALPLARSGRLKAIAVSTDTRSPAAPDIPTIAESGLTGFSVGTWYGLMAPGNMPTDLVERLNQEVNNALLQPDLQARLASFGMQPRPQTASQFSNFLKKEVDKWAAVIKGAGVQAE